MSPGDKLLVVGPSWIGDTVMAQSLYRLLMKRTPKPEIHVIAPRWSLPVVARMPEVARGIELALTHGELGLSKRYALGRRLRSERYQQAIILPRSAKAALVPFFARVPRRTGFRGEWRYGLLNDIRRYDPLLDQTVKRFAALGRERTEGALSESQLPRPRLAVDPANRERLWQELGLPTDRPLTALMPGAEYGPAKRWPSERFAELAARLTQIGVGVLVLGSAKERELGEAVRREAKSPMVWNLCGETTLVDAIDLLSAVETAVSNDSGLMHVAAATDAHVIGIYGSSSPSFTPPLTDTKTVLYRALVCSPCFEKVCPLGHLNCLRDISVAVVLDAVLASLKDRPDKWAKASFAGPAGEGR